MHVNCFKILTNKLFAYYLPFTIKSLELYHAVICQSKYTYEAGKILQNLKLLRKVKTVQRPRNW